MAKLGWHSTNLAPKNHYQDQVAQCNFKIFSFSSVWSSLQLSQQILAEKLGFHILPLMPLQEQVASLSQDQGWFVGQAIQMRLEWEFQEQLISCSRKKRVQLISNVTGTSINSWIPQKILTHVWFKKRIPPASKILYKSSNRYHGITEDLIC